MTGAALAIRSTAVPANEWSLYAMQADALAMSDIVPAAYRRKPANILVASLTGRSFGWDTLTAMNNGHVIEGKWGMKPEAMLGLVRAAGHSVTGKTDAKGATVTGKRHDTGDEMTVTFSIEDASRAGLAGKGTWKAYPQMMCYWRAVGLLCRMLFSDVTLGVYTSEELTGDVEEEDRPIEATMVPAEAEPVPLSEENLSAFSRACEGEGLDPERVLDEAFGEGVRPVPLTDADLPAMRDAFRTLVERASSSGGESGMDGSIPSDSPPDTDSGEPTDDDPDPTLPGVRTMPATRAQVGAIKGHYHRLGVEDRLTQLSWTSQFLDGRRLATHNDLNRGEAHRLLEILAMATELG